MKINFSKRTLSVILSCAVALLGMNTTVFAANNSWSATNCGEEQWGEVDNIIVASIDDLLVQVDSQTVDVDEEYRILSGEYETEYPDVSFCAYFWVNLGYNTDGSLRITSINDWGIIWDLGILPSINGIIPSSTMTTPYYWGAYNHLINSRVTIELRTSSLLEPLVTETHSVTAYLYDNITL